jgi:hypothetical protein
MLGREKRFSILPGCSRFEIGAHRDLQCLVAAAGAHVVLFAVAGFLMIVMFGFGHADRINSAAHGQIQMADGMSSPIVIPHPDAPIAKLAPAATGGCRP